MDPEGIGGPDPPLKNHKNIGFPLNTVPDPLKNHKATESANISLGSILIIFSSFLFFCFLVKNVNIDHNQ